MHLSVGFSSVEKSDAGFTFEFTPLSTTVGPHQPRQVADRGIDGDRFDISNRSDDFKIHSAILRGNECVGKMSSLTPSSS